MNYNCNKKVNEKINKCDEWIEEGYDNESKKEIMIDKGHFNQLENENNQRDCPTFKDEG